MNHIKQTFTKYKSHALLTTGLLYTGFTLGTIIDSAHKYEITLLKNKYEAEINKLRPPHIKNERQPPAHEHL
jgi:hypothetical protein